MLNMHVTKQPWFIVKFRPETFQSLSYTFSLAILSQGIHLFNQVKHNIIKTISGITIQIRPRFATMNPTLLLDRDWEKLGNNSFESDDPIRQA